MVCRIPSRRAASIALCGLLHLPGLSAVDPECRDRFYWPFSNASIWNTPIGSNASFVPAEIYNISYSVGCALRIGAAASLRTVCPGWNTTWTPAVCLTVGCCYDPITPDPNDVPWCYRPGGRPPQWGFHNDGDLIVLSTASNPLVPWLNQGNWNPGNHCSATGPQATAVPLPADFVTPCGGGNNAMALLLPDNCTLVQMQPAFRQDAESPLLALYHEGGPVPFPWEISITGDGAAGAHGGSGLSSMGGTIRSGELRPSSPPLRHALKLELFAHDYYFSNGTAAPYTECFRWPALGCDGYAHDASSPLSYNGTVPGMQPGTLLAIPPGRLVPVVTIPGRRIRDALATFGGYIVDDTASDSGAFCMEPAVSQELLSDYGINPDINTGHNSATDAFFGDLVKIYQALSIVRNNAPSSVGGGGEPLAPLAPPLCGTPCPSQLTS